jgi:hypothetical protein
MKKAARMAEINVIKGVSLCAALGLLSLWDFFEQKKK